MKKILFLFFAFTGLNLANASQGARYKTLTVTGPKKVDCMPVTRMGRVNAGFIFLFEICFRLYSSGSINPIFAEREPNTD